jgi:hypothetical protein
MRIFIAALILCITFSAISSSAQNKSSRREKPTEAPKNTMPAQKPKPAKATVNYTVNWGPDLKLKGEALNKILLYNKGSFFAITDNAKGLFSNRVSEYISKFNKNLELEKQVKLESEKSEKGMSQHIDVKLFEYNDAIYLITREKDGKNKRIVYFAENIDLETLMCQGNKKQIYELSYAEDKKRDDALISFQTNKKKDVMIILDQLYTEKEQNVKVVVSALDKNLAPMWKKDVTLPLTLPKGGHFGFSTYMDNAPNLYLMSRVYKEITKRKVKDVIDGELNYDYHIYTIGKDIPSFVDYSFDLKDKAVSQAELDINTNGDLIACGFYSDINEKKDRATGVKGFFYTTIDPVNKTIKTQSYKKFENDVFTAGLSAKKAEKAEAKLEDGKDGATYGFGIDQLIPRKDGGGTIIMEQAYTYVTSYRCGNSICYRTHYVYNNIMVTKVNAAGEIEWTTVIPKRQHYVAYPAVGSYFVFDQGNDTYDFYYNDDKDNLNDLHMDAKGADVASDRLKSLRFVRQVVNPDGSLSKREEAFKMDEDDENTHFFPTVSKIVADNEIILYGMERRKDKFARITYRGLEVAE